MNTKRTLIGMAVAGILLSTVACGGGSDTTNPQPSQNPPVSAGTCKADADCASGEVCSSAGTCETPAPAAPANLTFDQIAGKWQATSYVVTMKDGTTVDVFKTYPDHTAAVTIGSDGSLAFHLGYGIGNDPLDFTLHGSIQPDNQVSLEEAPTPFAVDLSSDTLTFTDMPYVYGTKASFTWKKIP